MAKIAFYHLTTTTFDKVLPTLLYKAVQSKRNSLVLCKDDEQILALSNCLWDKDSSLWLPHGFRTAKQISTEPQWQPIWLSTIEENLNHARFVFLIGEQILNNYTSYERIFDLFDGNNEHAVQFARERWAKFKMQQHDLSYWKQTTKGWKQQK